MNTGGKARAAVAVYVNLPLHNTGLTVRRGHIEIYYRKCFKAMTPVKTDCLLEFLTAPELTFTAARKITHSPLNCSDPDPSSSQQTPGQEGSHWEVWGRLLSGLEDPGPPGSDGMEDSPLSLDSAPEASPPAAQPEMLQAE